MDMTPMVDMAFLLVTFFLLATTFKTGEPTSVEVPKSVAGLNLPMTDLLTILVDREGKVFLSLTSQQARREWLHQYAMLNQTEYTEDEYHAFELISGFGIPMTNLRSYLSTKPEARKKIKQTGIPVKGERNELAEWILLARVTTPRLRVAIKADKDTPYNLVEDVVSTLTEINVLRFNLITQSKKTDD